MIQYFFQTHVCCANGRNGHQGQHRVDTRQHDEGDHCHDDQVNGDPHDDDEEAGVRQTSYSTF